MNNPELDKILASVDATVRRAYALGRKDALDQLVKYARSDEVASPPLALAPPEPGPEPVPEAAPARMEGANDDAGVEDARMTPLRTGTGGITGMILDFVYPPKAK